MIKSCKTIITTFKDGTSNTAYEGGKMIHEVVNHGWKVTDKKRYEIPSTDEAVAKVEVFEYTLENADGLILG